jgi:hypothetical protein
MEDNMRTLTCRTLWIVVLALIPFAASADDRFDNRYRYNNGPAVEWRLGASLGGYRGYAIMYRTGNRWIRAPGQAVAVGDGWVLGTDRHVGGYGIYRWNGHDWDRAPGTAVRIGGSYNRPWVINDRNIRYEWNGYDWRETGFAGRNPFSAADRLDRNARDRDRFDREDPRDRRFDDRDRDRDNNGRRNNDWRNGRDDPPRRDRW